MSEELDTFIQAQKQKIAEERNKLTENGVLTSTNDNASQERKKWDRGKVDFQPAVFATPAKTSAQNESPDWIKPFSTRRMKTPEHVGLPLGTYEDKRKKLFEERSKEYNDLLAKSPAAVDASPSLSRTPRRPQNEIPPGGAGSLPLGANEQNRRQLEQERQKEYNELLNKQADKTPNRAPPKTPPQQGLPLGAYEEKRKAYDAQKRQDFLALNQQQKPNLTTPRPRLNTPQHEGLALSDNKRQQEDLAQQRQIEYNQLVNKQKGRNPSSMKENVSPGVGMFDKLGTNERKKKQLDDERSREYNQFLQEANYRSGRGGPPQKADNGAYETEEDFARSLREAQPRKGWATPTHEEILEKKRHEEQRFRRNEDPEVYSRGRGQPDNYMRSSRSEGHINRDYDTEDRLRQLDRLDREYDAKRVRFAEKNPLPDTYSIPTRYNLEDDDEYLSRDRYERPVRDTRSRSPPVRDRDSGPRNVAPSPAKKTNTTPRQREQPNVGATLNIGREVRASADIRRKEAYRKELESQMAELKAAKKKEKEADLSSPSDGFNTNRTSSRRVREEVPDSPRREQPPARAPPPQPPIQPPLNLDPYGRPPTVGDLYRQQGGILSNGFGEQLYRPNAVPPQFGAQPGMAGPAGAGLYRSPMEDAYSYFANRNPMDPAALLGGPPVAAHQLGLAQSPLLSGLAGLYPGAPPPPGVPNLQLPQDEPAQRPPAPESSRRKPPTPKKKKADGFPFGEDERSRSRNDSKKSYQEELKQQMEEQRLKKQKAKEEQEKYDAKLEAEIRNYDPFGRGGGGAPMKDKEGNVVADLRKKDTIDPNAATTPRAPGPSTHRSEASPPELSAPTATALSPTGAGAEQTFARGGHGIFGDPKTEAQKTAQERYQDELRIQIEEKKRKKQEEDAAQKAEEEKMIRKIEEDNRKMQEELENDKRKEREKVEEAQKKAEELKRQQEEKQKSAEEKRRAADAARDEKIRKQQEEDRARKAAEDRGSNAPTARGSSPPIPTLRGKEDPPAGRKSPPIPTHNNRADRPPSKNEKNASKPPSRASSRNSNRAKSADALSHLARLRQQLESERERLNQQLEREQTQPLVYDPRIPTEPTGRGKNNIDVFEVARKKEPVVVTRQSRDSPNPKNLKDFEDLKSKTKTDGMSREASTSSNLEFQQRLLLEKQEQELLQRQKSLKQKTAIERAMPDMNPKDLGLARTPSSLSNQVLESESTWIDIPDRATPAIRPNLANRTKRRSEAPATPRAPSPATKNDPMGSVMSLDVEAINRRNEDRMRKLKKLGGERDDISIGNPDEILDQFMASQRHNRPPSGRTLMDDTWLSSAT